MSHEAFLGAPSLGGRIRAIRLERGMSRHALASAVGMSRTHLICLECGLVDPTVALVRRIADALDVEFAVLLLPAEHPLVAGLESLRGLPVHERPLAIVQLIRAMHSPKSMA